MFYLGVSFLLGTAHGILRKKQKKIQSIQGWPLGVQWGKAPLATPVHTAGAGSHGMLLSEWPVSSTTGGTSCSAVLACFEPLRIRVSASVSIQVTTAMVESCLLSRSYRLRTLIFPNSFLDLSDQITEGTNTLPAFALRVPCNPEILGPWVIGSFLPFLHIFLMASAVVCWHQSLIR